MKKKISKAFSLLLVTIACMLACFGCTKANEAFKLVGEPTFTCTYDEESEAYDVVVTGVAKNESDKKWEWASVTFMLYDEEHNVVGSASCSVEYIAPQNSWKFRATGTTSYETVSIELYEFNGYLF